MKFYPLTDSAEDTAKLSEDFRSAREVGSIRLGRGDLYFKRWNKVYYIPYRSITRCFRRVMMVPAKLCCGRGEFRMENLVVCSGEREVAQIPLPGTKAARILMEELQTYIPHAEFSKAGGKP